MTLKNKLLLICHQSRIKMFLPIACDKLKNVLFGEDVTKNVIVENNFNGGKVNVMDFGDGAANFSGCKNAGQRSFLK
jgi:hypothetical protein